MNRQASCFNWALFRSNTKRFWWVSALHLLGILLLGILPLYIDYHDRAVSFYGAEHYANSRLLSASIFPYLILGVLTVGLSALLFSYLNSKSATATMHAVPLKRKTLYITNVVFGLLSLTLPILIGGGVLLLMRANPNISHTISLSHVGLWMATQFAYAIIGFSFSVFIGMLTANSVAHLVLTYIFALLPLFIEAAIREILKLNLYGYAPYSVENFVNRFVYLDIAKLCTLSGFLTYLAYSVVLLIGGYFIYKARHLENTAEIVAFPRLKPIFIYGVAVCFGVAGYFYLAELLRLCNLYLMLPFGILGLVIANMLTKKAFTLKGSLIPAAALVATVSAVFCLFHFDLTGFERRVPTLSKIEGVSVTESAPAYRNYYGMTDGKKLVLEHDYFPLMTEKEDIEHVLKFHRHKTMERMEEGDRVLYVQYRLAGGKVLTRRYTVDYAYDKNLLAPIMESEENRMDRFPVLQGQEQYLTAISINDQRLPNGFQAYFAKRAQDAQVLSKLIAALKADTLAVPYEEFIFGEATLTRINLEYAIPLVYEGTNTVVSQGDYKNGYTGSHIYYVRPSYTNTIAVLGELGFYDAIPTADAFSAIEVRRYGADGRMETFTITERGEIAEIYQYVIDTQFAPIRDVFISAAGAMTTDVAKSNVLWEMSPDVAKSNALRISFVSETNAFSVERALDDAMPQSLKNLLK